MLEFKQQRPMEQGSADAMTGPRPITSVFVQAAANHLSRSIIHSVILSVLILVLSGPVSRAQPIDRSKTDILTGLNIPLATLQPAALQFHIGVGPILFSTLDGGARSKSVGVLPLFAFEYRDIVAVNETEARVNLSGSTLGAEGLRFGPTVNVDPGRGTLGRALPAGVGKVGLSVEVGGFASYKWGPAVLRVRVRQDIAGGHSGAVANYDLTTDLFRVGGLGVGAEVETTWASKNYMRSFFGVDALQAARTGLPLYDPGSGFKDATLTLFGRHKFSSHWSALGALQYVRLLGNAADSPITRSSGAFNQINLGFFVIYTFGRN